jgi:hypothetical protein
MDLKNLTPTSDTIEVILVHPNTLEPLMNEGLAKDREMTITLYAPHSKEYKKLVHEQTDKRLSQMQKSKKVQISAADLERSSIDILAKATKEWDITYDGESPKLTVPKAREIYTEYFWIKDQLEEAINDTLDFTKA